MYNDNYYAVYCWFIVIFETKSEGDSLCRPLVRRRPRPVARGNATALRLCCSSNCETLPATTDPLRNPVEVLLHTVLPCPHARAPSKAAAPRLCSASGPPAPAGQIWPLILHGFQIPRIGSSPTFLAPSTTAQTRALTPTSPGIRDSLAACHQDAQDPPPRRWLILAFLRSS